jgi:uncharacterized protein YcbK (DUF882 family)
MNRRDFLKFGLITGIYGLVPKSFGRIVNSYFQERTLYFYNTHTGEFLKETFYENGRYNKAGLKKIFYILRDFRTNEIAEIDIKLIDTLYILTKTLEVNNKPINIISGYRSPKTNNLLREISSGVAKNSLHMQGKAIDINISGVPLHILRDVAISLKAGGVGYYPSSNFVHIDTGKIRYW